MELFKGIEHENDAGALVVTHDQRAIDVFDWPVYMENGVLREYDPSEQLTPQSAPKRAILAWIGVLPLAGMLTLGLYRVQNLLHWTRTGFVCRGGLRGGTTTNIWSRDARNSSESRLFVVSDCGHIIFGSRCGGISRVRRTTNILGPDRGMWDHHATYEELQWTGYGVHGWWRGGWRFRSRWRY